MPAKPDLGSGGSDRAQGQHVQHGRHLPARQARLGRPRRGLHDRAEHLRRHLVVVDAGRQAGRAGQPAGLQDGPRPSTASSCRTQARRTPPTRASTSAWRSTRPARSPCGTTPRWPRACSRPPTAPSRARTAMPSRRSTDQGLGLAVDLGARDPEELARPGGRLEVHRLGDRPAVHQGRRHAHQGRLGFDPAGTRASTYAIPQYKKAAAAFAAKTLAAMKAAPINNPGTTKRPGLPGGAVRRHTSVPGRRHPVHPALLERDRRLDEVLGSALSQVPADRLASDQVSQ